MLFTVLVRPAVRPRRTPPLGSVCCFACALHRADSQCPVSGAEPPVDHASMRYGAHAGAPALQRGALRIAQSRFASVLARSAPHCCGPHNNPMSRCSLSPRDRSVRGVTPVAKRATPHTSIGGAAGAAPPLSSGSRDRAGRPGPRDRAVPDHLGLDSAALLGAGDPPPRRSSRGRDPECCQ